MKIVTSTDRKYAAWGSYMHDTRGDLVMCIFQWAHVTAEVDTVYF